jgi:hypothetical protein
MWCVYEHISPSNKVYVGITSRNPLKRWKGGSGYVRKDNHQPLFANAIIKYGWDNIVHRIVASELTFKEASDMEKFLIRKYKSEERSYNITDGGEGALGTHHTDATKDKLRKLRLGTKTPQQFINKAIENRIANYKYIIIATDGKCIYKFKTRNEAAKALGINNASNISGALAGKQCLVNGYIFLHWDKSIPIDKDYIFHLYNVKVNNRYKNDK